MATTTDYILSTDQAQAFQSVHEGLVEQGFTVTSTPNGGLHATRGSAVATALLGGLAGKKFHIAFVVNFMTDSAGRLVARITRDMTSGALKGGAVGAVKTGNAFTTTTDALEQRFAQAGILTQRIDHG